MNDQTGQDSGAVLRFTGWGGGWRWGGHFEGLFDFGRRTPVFSFGTHTHSGTREAISPRRIAEGYGDRYLIAMNKAIADYGRPIYIRPMAEMNGHWNFYCAFNSNGTSRGKLHSTKSFRLAFKRIYLILHGGDVATMNTRFANWRVRKLQSDRLTLPENAYPTLKVFWNPQGFGSPDIAANSADAYYPGDDYVDVVGDDIYDQGGRYEYDAMVDLYRAYPGKPFAIGEFGPLEPRPPASSSRTSRRSSRPTRAPNSRSSTARSPDRSSISGTSPEAAQPTSVILTPLGN